jgi:benzoylformate decarboxylase
MLEGVASTCSFPFTHPQYAGAMPRLAPQIRALLLRHDLLFSVGADLFTLSLPSEVDPMPPGITVVHLDVNPWELGKNYPAAVALLGDPKATLPELCEALRRHTTPRGHPEAARRRELVRAEQERARRELEERARREAGQVPMTPLALIHAVATSLPGHAVVVDEAISAAPGLRSLLRSADARAFYGLRGGGIGWGVPAALGIKLAQPERPVVALVGDGSALYSHQALWTAAHEGLAVVVVVINNASYRILKQRIRALKGFAAQDERYVGMDLDRPPIDWVGLARAQGVPGERVDKAAELPAVLHRALQSQGPFLIDARVDPSVS